MICARLCPVAGLLIFALVAVTTSPASAQTAHTDVQVSLDALHAWLDTSDNGQGWKNFLKVDELQDQLNNSEDADLDVLQSQLELYGNNNRGLRKQRFVDVREAISAWIEELQLPTADALPEAASAAVEELEPIDEEDLTNAKQRLARQATQFENFLKRGGAARDEGWRKYLRWDDFTEQLQQESPDWETMVQVWAILAGDAPGLNYREFVQLRESLREYVELAEFFVNEENALTSLPGRLDAYQKESDEQSTAALGMTLAWLERTKQAESVVGGIRKHGAKPNLLLDFSEQLVVYGFAQDVDETDPVSNSGGGNSTSGTAHTVAAITAELAPNGARGEVTVSMIGEINSSTRTYNNQGVSFNTTGVTSVDADKAVYFVDQGLRDDPAEARCVTDNTNSNIRANSAQVENIARQRIAERERSSEYQSARRSEQNVESDLNKRVREQLDDANDQLQQDFYLPMQRRGVSPRYVRFNSTQDSMHQRMILAAPEHLAAPNDPPPIKVDGDVVARAHASWANNLADITLRGTVMTDVGLAEALEQWRGEVPEELKITDESEPWDLTFAARRPVRMEFAKDRMTLTLRGRRFTARNRVMNEPMHISASYKVKRDGKKISLVRDGDVNVSFPNQGERLSVRYVSMRNFWRTKFSALFVDEFDELDLRLRGAWESAGPLKLTALGVSPDGWIGLAWKMPEK